MTLQNWSQLTRSLVDVSMGRVPADLVIRNGRWICVQSGEIISQTDIAVKNKRIAYVGPDATHTIGKNTQVIEAANQYLVPGLLDGHMHVESGMLTVTEFVRAVAPRGTTGMFIDPHEIANVFGMKGVKLMVDEAALQPIHVWVQMPSCVPSAPGLETSGAVFGPGEVSEAMNWEGIIGLGEMMNFPGVYNCDEEVHAEMAETRRVGKVIGGHYASHNLGLPFHGYAAGGPEDDHEGTRLEDALARVRQGMKPMLRLGSAWHDVAEQARAITEMGVDSRHFILCTDDSHAETLINDGHMDRVVRYALSRNIEPITVIQMATLNTAEHFGVAKDVGQIAPGRYADILLVDDLEKFDIKMVLAKGQIVAEAGRLLTDLPAFSYPNWAVSSVNRERELKESDFILETQEDGKYTANVIGVIENQAPTKYLQFDMISKKGVIGVDINRDIAKVAVVERHKVTSDRVQVGLVHGFGFTERCAIGSTVAHDSHNMIIVGTDETYMALAANKLDEVEGGQVVIHNGEIIGLVELPIAGLMSVERADIVAKKAATILNGFKFCGCTINNPIMQLSFLALVVIPEIRISDLGLVDVTNYKFIPVLEQKNINS